MENTELRPLGAGEILDRAVTLLVRRFVPIVLVLAAAIAPVLILEAIIAPGSTRLIADMGRVMTAGSKAQTSGALEALTRDQAGATQYLIVILLSYGSRILMWSAILAVASAAYAGATISFADAYRIGLRRWLSQLVVGVAFLVLAMVATLPLFIAYFIAIVAVVSLAALNAGVLAAIVGVLAGIVVIAGFALVGAWIFMTYQLASAAVVIENVSPIAAVTLGIRRTTSRQTFWRTVVGGLILLVVTQGGVLVLAGVGLALGALTKIPSLSFAILGAGQIIVDGLLAVFVVVFATDIRVRREGLDLVAMTGAAP